MFEAGLALSATALLLCGAAPAFGGLLAARVLQGAGAALVFASAPALVTLASGDAARQRALGWYNFAFGIGIVLGPLAGGLLVAAWGWRAVYLARVPLAVAALVLARQWRPAAGIGGGRRDAVPAGDGVADRRAFVVANAANLLANLALFFVWLLVPYYLIEQRGLAVGAAGLLFAVGTLATALGAPLGGWCADRWGARAVVPVALGVEALGLLLTSRLEAGSTPLAIALALALAGAGVGLFTVPNMHYVMAALPRARQGWAGSLVVLMRMGGIVLGASVATQTLEGRATAHRAAGLAEGAATASAFADAFRLAAAIAALAALLSLVPPRARGRRPGDVRVRRLRAADRAAAVALINEAARWYREFLPLVEVHDPEMTEAAFEAEGRRMTWYGAEGPDGALLGVMGLEYVGDVALLRHAYVLPPAQRQGVGSRLRRHLEAEVRGVERIVVGTYAANYKARGVLEKAGYVPCADSEATLRRYYAIPEDRLRTSVAYEKRLPRTAAAGDAKMAAG